MVGGTFTPLAKFYYVTWDGAQVNSGVLGNYPNQGQYMWGAVNELAGPGALTNGQNFQDSWYACT